MTKRDLIKWLESKKAKALYNAKEEANKLELETKELYWKALGVDQFVDAVVPIFEQVFEEYQKYFAKFDNLETVTISKFNYRYGYNDILRLTEKPRLKETITECIRFDHDHEREQKIQEIRKTVRKVEDTYDMVIQTTKNLPTAKDGIEYLKKLGFDVSQIQPAEQKKQLPATISVNVDVQYLLLTKKEETNENA